MDSQPRRFKLLTAGSTAPAVRPRKAIATRSQAARLCRDCGQPVTRAEVFYCDQCRPDADRRVEYLPGPEQTATEREAINAAWCEEERLARADTRESLAGVQGLRKGRRAKLRPSRDVWRQEIEAAAWLLGDVYAAAVDPTWRPDPAAWSDEALAASRASLIVKHLGDR